MHVLHNCCNLLAYVGPTTIAGCYAGNECSEAIIPLTSTGSAAAQVRECCLNTAGLSYNLLGECIKCVSEFTLSDSHVILYV